MEKKYSLPLVSVIMCVYNEEKYMIAEAIKSVLAQTYSNLELIIVCDNPSSLEMREQLSCFREERVKVFFNEKNIGAALSRNVGVENSRGDYVAILDADDVCEANRITVEMDYLVSKSYDMVCAGRCYIDENGNSIEKEDEVITEEDLVKQLLYKNNVTNSTVLMRKDIFLKLGGYRDYPCAHDYEFWMRIDKAGYKIGYLSNQLIKYRIRSNSITSGKEYLQVIVGAYAKKRYKKGTILNDYSLEDFNKFLKRYSVGKEKTIQRYKNSVDLRKEVKYNMINKEYILAIKNYSVAILGSRVYRLSIYNSIEFKMKQIYWKYLGEKKAC